MILWISVSNSTFLFGSLKQADVSHKAYVSFLSGCSHSRAGMSLFSYPYTHQNWTIEEPRMPCMIRYYTIDKYNMFQHEMLIMQFLPFGNCA